MHFDQLSANIGTENIKSRYESGRDTCLVKKAMKSQIKLLLLGAHSPPLIDFYWEDTTWHVIQVNYHDVGAYFVWLSCLNNFLYGFYTFYEFCNKKGRNLYPIYKWNAYSRTNQ